MPLNYALYHGNEEWVLKGIATDLQASLLSLNASAERSDAFKDPWSDAETHIFVQQGQLLRHVQREGTAHLSQSICLYTHYDRTQCSPTILNQCKALVFNSSIQLSTAIANGIDPRITHLCHYGVNPTVHRPLYDIQSRAQVVDILGRDYWKHAYRKSVGFCGRYWDKPSYTRRKNYPLILELVSSLHKLDIPVIFLGVGWEKLLPKSLLKSDSIRIVQTNYINYPLFYNAMNLLVSPSLYESGPFPVLEAMSCGTYPISSATGMSLDIITNPIVGKVLPLSSTASQYLASITEKLSSTVDHRSILHTHAANYSFENLARFIVRVSS